MKKIAVVLSGCGVFDGSEIHEATATLLALDRANVNVTICAPAGPQMHVVDHQTGEPATGEKRDILVESARIARGAVADIATLDAADFDAVILPGGFGAAKNLSTFAIDGADARINPAVADFLKAAHAAGKTIGAMCIAPAVIAGVFGPDIPVSLTIGNDPGTAAAIEKMGAKHLESPVDGVIIDRENKIVSTPAYMLAGRISEVFTGVAKLVDAVLEIS